jgi:tRNA(His) 5'-end guanylyltransferase
MANSVYGYVRDFETPDSLPLSNWIVVRIDGRGFSKLTKKYNFTKPNDIRALDLMNAAAIEVTKSLVDIVRTGKATSTVSCSTKTQTSSTAARRNSPLPSPRLSPQNTACCGSSSFLTRS